MLQKIFIIAGEASGDLHGAHLVRHLRTESANRAELYGVGGDRMRRAGVLEFLDIAHFHVTGFTESLKHLPDYHHAEKKIIASLERVRPDLVVLIDNPGFNLHLAARILKQNIPIVYYITPQIWAWAPQRIEKIKKIAKKVLVVFQFEEKLYRDHGVPVTWVGHPLKDRIEEELAENSSVGLPEKPLACQIALLPGSRQGEIKTLLPILIKTAESISKKIPEATFVVLKSPSVSLSFYETFLQKARGPLRLAQDRSYETIRQSALALVCSGTATLECALLRTPMVITNRGSLLTYLIARCLIRVPYLGLPNLIMGEKIIPELLQYDATPEKLSREACDLLMNKQKRLEMIDDLEKVGERLGPPGATRRAAIEILKLL